MMMKRVGLTLLFSLILFAGHSQADSPVAYMESFSVKENELQTNYLGYITAVNHGRTARKLEKRRKEVLTTVKEAQQNASHMKAFRGDTALRNAYARYYSILLLVLAEDYGKIVNLEEIAEQSYDNMEAYLMAQEKAGEKLDTAAKRRQTAYRQFAKNNNVRLIESENKTAKKLEQSNLVNSYYHQIYLIFFRSNKQEYYLINALNGGNLNELEQNRSTLSKYAQEGLKKLAVIKSFENDYTVVAACKKMLEFYYQESEKKMPLVTNFLLKKEEFNKTKKAFEIRPESERTEEDVKRFNKLVDEINTASNVYNQTNNEMNSTRNNLTNQWTNTVRDFLDNHTP